MCALSPPFYSQNMLLLATTIVEGKYEPLNTALYSSEIVDMVGKCLMANNEQRPDIVGVAQMMTVKLMLCIDDVIRQQYNQLQKKIARQNAGGDNHFDASRSSADTNNQSLNSSLTLSDSVGSSSVSQLQLRTVSRGKIMPAQIKDRKNPIRALRVPVDVAVKPDQQSKKVKAMSAKVVPVAGGASRARSNDRRHRRTASASGLPVILPNKAQQQPRKSAWPGEQPDEPLFLPTIRRVNSSSSVETQRRNNQQRMSSAGSMVSIATEKLKPITDPILELLGVLHSVMFISQLPHEGVINHKRRVIDQFRRRLFSKESSGIQIKAELRKLSAQSRDPVKVNLGYSDYRPVLEGVDVIDLDEGGKVEHLTYEQLYACIHIVLAENDAVQMRELRPPSRLTTSGGRNSVNT
uniref:Uncharacterized protein n=1 Tax=Plectus sambesii TaxID=2011161 RepID=A0A914XRC9_9BILA